MFSHRHTNRKKFKETTKLLLHHYITGPTYISLLYIPKYISIFIKYRSRPKDKPKKPLKPFTMKNSSWKSSNKNLVMIKVQWLVRKSKGIWQNLSWKRNGKRPRLFPWATLKWSPLHPHRPIRTPFCGKQLPNQICSKWSRENVVLLMDMAPHLHIKEWLLQLLYQKMKSKEDRYRYDTICVKLIQQWWY